MTREINGYRIETCGGHILVKHWIVYDKDNKALAIYFRYSKAKNACLKGNFDDGYKGKLYN